MTSYWQGQRLLSVLQQVGRRSALGIALEITLLGVFLSASAQAAVFTINSPFDVSDANPGNGVCETAPGNGTCTLRAAIQEANTLAGDDTIILPPNTYLLTQVTELTITGNLTITGGEAGTTIIDGNRSIRANSGVLTITGIPPGGIAVNISGVTIRNGGSSGQGGSINNGGTLMLSNSTVSGNSANGGGGIFNGGTFTLTNSAVSGNNDTSGRGGGGISNSGTLTLTNSTVSGNSSTVNGGGIFNSGTLTLTNSTVSSNSAPLSGGIANSGGTLTLIDSTVSGNGRSVAGGISNFIGTVTLINSTVSGNNGGTGGISNQGGTMTLINSTVSGNTGTGIVNNEVSTLTLTNSTVSGNASSIAVGGGVRNFGTATLTNSTVSGNTGSRGGGIFNQIGTLTLSNSTVSGNGATGSVGGIWNEAGATFNFQNTILAGNFTFGLPTSSDCMGAINSNGNNLMGSLDCLVNGGGVTVADPKLGPLQNSGPTQTHALLSGSPAIDAGNPNGCRDQFGVLLTTDQRGLSRPADGNNDSVAACDIGAFELQAATGLVSAVLPSSRSVQVGVAATAFATVINTAQAIAVGCSISPLASVPASFIYQTTDPATNQVTGSPNTPANIAAGAAQSFVFAITPAAPIVPTDVLFSFACSNTEPAPINVGLNTLLLSASDIPVPDIVALTATTTNDGILNIPGTNGTGAFAVATVNVGATGTITASADTGSGALPVNISLCQTDPATGQCISALGPIVTTMINANATPTFGIFVQGNGNVPFDPAANRIFVRFKDGGGVTRGSTSVAVRTQ